MAARLATGDHPDAAAASSLAQVFDALSYYSDHQEEIHRHIELNRFPDHLIDPLVNGS